MLRLSPLNKVSFFSKSSALRMIVVSVVLASAASGQFTEKVLIKSLISGNGGLIFDQHGDLYGTDQKLTRFGAVYRLHHFPNGTWGKTILHHFSGTDGASPEPNLVFDNAGNLYGSTTIGGIYNDGTVYQLSPTASGTWTEKVLYNFQFGTHGWDPSPVIIDGAGNLYGTTFFGPNGTIFELVHNSHGTWTHKVLYQFTGGTDGRNPQGALVRDSAGNLYGTTFDGTERATVFELSPETNGSWTFHLVHTFCSRAKCTDGNPGFGSASVTLDNHGNLYGMTSQGGNPNCSPALVSGCGTVFKITHTKIGAWTFQVLHSFCLLDGCVDGQFPGGGVILDGVGNVYGVTLAGGANRFGTVFKVSHAPGHPWTEEVLYSFCSVSNCADGKGPLGSLVIDNAGNLFGTTLSAVFELQRE